MLETGAQQQGCALAAHGHIVAKLFFAKTNEITSPGCYCGEIITSTITLIKREHDSTITMYYDDAAFWGDMRLQKKGDTSQICRGEVFLSYLRLLPNPSYPAL